MPAPDNFTGQPGVAGPGEHFAAVTKSDTADLPFRCRWLYVGVTGDVTVLDKDGSTSVTFKAVPVGRLDVRTQRVMSTGTTATNIVAVE